VAIAAWTFGEFMSDTTPFMAREFESEIVVFLFTGMLFFSKVFSSCKLKASTASALYYRSMSRSFLVYGWVLSMLRLCSGGFFLESPPICTSLIS